ncbi:NADH dehydrogenase subunit M [Thermanaeromonas toyohensis ToBE]|uniref:NADH dehydrogenase subunit M n=1 Tax=Thermanaeromonas toyohensis ToBE TaxID=698762 RepID=A0A1W1VPU0_9FIRM|nr:NADH-quinone oxidoreductase subunit M [Thermanaeromonas toyohensis]SMB95392.1 NADH dehydrogenase subunit M [Thermanaeromonas toyohensis ToBE]
MSFPLLTAILLAPVIGIILILFIPEREQLTIKITAAVATFVSLVLSIYAYAAYDQVAGGLQFLEDRSWIPALGVNYSVGVDGISLPMVLLTALVIFTGVFASWDMTHRIKEFFLFLLMLVTGVFGVFISRDLFFFYLFFEVAVIPMYLLIGIWGSTRKEYAAMKLTLYLLVGSAFALIGIIALYLYAARQLGYPTFDIQTLATVQYDIAFQKFVFFLFLIGFGVLVPIWPLHLWSPDGHVAAPTAVSMLHAGVLMKLGAYGLIRVGVFFLPEGAKFWAPLIAVLCIVNVVYGAMIAMVQRDLKFVIGYSSVSHMGYVLLGIAALNTLSLSGAVTQMFAHGIMTALFFALVGNIYHKAHTREIARFGGLAHQMPRVAAGFLIGGLASLGLPGLHNFVAEFLIFLGAFTREQGLFGGFLTYRALAILAILGIVITATYVLRVVQRTFFGPRKEDWDHLEDARGVEMVPIVVLCTTLILFGLFPSLMGDLIYSGVAPLVAKIEAARTIGGIF